MNYADQLTRARILCAINNGMAAGLPFKAAKAAAALELRRDGAMVSDIRQSLSALKASGSAAYGVALRVLRGMDRTAGGSR